MANNPPIRVALDLETTGLHAEQDAILEVAAIRFQGATILDTFETFVAPGRPIPYRVQRLTGITPQQLTDAPTFESICRKLQFFLGDFPLVGHSIPFDVSFLQRRGLVHTNPLVDTFELATVLLPSLPSYNLGQVAAALDVAVGPGRHRAMVDAELAMNVFLQLHQRLQEVDLTLLNDLANLDAPDSWPLLVFFRQELRERQRQDGLRGVPMRGNFGERMAAGLGMDPRVLSFAIARQDAKAGQSIEAAASEDGRLQGSDGTNAVFPGGQAIVSEEPDVPGEETLPLDVEAQFIVPEEEPVQATDIETIPEQAEQAVQRGYQAAQAAVREALEQRTSLLMEVTIGGNDYTPALLPALEWLSEAAAENAAPPKRLVIACSSQQSARRLVEKVLPRLQASLKSHLPLAYLAEHGGYLCTHRWFGATVRRTSGKLTAEQARGFAKLGLWAQQTLTGERSELTMLPQEVAVWERVSSSVERIPTAEGRSGNAYQRCTYRREGYCFLSRAEERVKAATIVVTTHAGLFDDLSHTHSLLTTIDRRLILDADLLEEENARWSSAELNQIRLVGLLNTIGAELPKGRYQGLLALTALALREEGPGSLSTTPIVEKSELDARMLSWFQVLRQARAAVDNLFGTFSRLLEEFLQQGSSGDGKDKGRSDSTGRSHAGRNVERTDQPLRLTGHIRNLGAWIETERTWQQVAQRLQAVIDLVHEAEKSLLTTHRGRHRLNLSGGEDDSLASELAAIAQQLLEQKRLGQQALSLGDSDMVYWLRMPPSPPPSTQQMAQQRQAEASTPSVPAPESSPVLHAQLVQTSALLRRLLLNTASCTIFAGAALSVDHSFSFCRGRFGLEHDLCPAFSVFTEHHEQTLLPEPYMPQYQRSLVDDAIVPLAKKLDGQLVVLFTSYAALRSSYAAVKQILEAQGILVLGQGIDGSPRQLWQMFHDQERVVLLGTGTFWDGVEEINRAPACLLIARLPMPVLNDPPIAARAEHYPSDQLHQLMVPMAALRVRRALNRLAWSDTQRNAVVLFDRRITSKEYGSMVLHTLPRCSQRQDAVSHMPETILDWLTTTGSWE